MKDKLVYAYFTTLTIIFSAALSLGMVQLQMRGQAYAAELLQKSLRETDYFKRSVLLEKALILRPDDQTRTALCELYLEGSDHDNYLRCQKKIRDEKTAKELTDYYRLKTEGKPTNGAPEYPITNIGKLWLSVVNDDYRSPGNTIVGLKISDLTKEELPNLHFKLNVAKILIDHKHGALGRIVLEKIKIAEGNNKSIQKLISQSFVADGDLAKALIESKILIGLDPSDINSYRYSLGIASSIENENEKRSLYEKISELEKLK